MTVREGEIVKKKVKEILRAAYLKHGNKVFRDTRRLIAYMDDWLYEYPVEKRRLSLAVNDGMIERLFTLEKKFSVERLEKIKKDFAETYRIPAEVTDDIIEILEYSIFYVDDFGTVKMLEASRGVQEETKTKQFQIEENVLTDFYGKESTFKIPDGVTVIADKVFRNNDNIESVLMGSNVQEIGESSFRDCKKLSSVTLNDNLKIVGKKAFCGCEGIKSIKIPDSVTEIQDNAFMKSGIAEISGMENVTLYGSGVFQECMGLKDVKIVSPVSDISDMMFYECKNLETVTLPETVKDIGNMAFSGCEKLYSVQLAKGLQTIGIWAFQDCKALKEIYIPQSVTKINEFAFEGCDDLSILGEYDSFAISFAEKKGIKFKII